jgi:hypothetical protein
MSVQPSILRIATGLGRRAQAASPSKRRAENDQRQIDRPWTEQTICSFLTPPAQSNKRVRGIQIVDVKDLEPVLRSKLEDVVAHASEEDMQSLRRSIDASREVRA